MTAPITVYIAEDEPLAREALVAQLARRPGWQVAGDAGDGRTALAACLAQPPDVLIADIRMPVLGGLELVGELRAAALPTHVVFVTAYDSHAIAAFKLAAVDYLLKPVSDAELRGCLERLERTVHDARTLQHIAHAGLDELLRTQRGWLRQIVVRSVGKVEVVPLAEVVVLRAEANYVEIVTRTGSWLHRETLRALGERLDPAAFVQVHRSAIVAVRELRGLERTPGGAQVTLASGHRVAVGATFMAQLQRVLRECHG